MPAANLVMGVNGMEKIEAEREMTEPRLTQRPQLSRSRLLVLCAAASLALGLVNIP
jgi:hypothetical protein